MQPNYLSTNLVKNILKILLPILIAITLTACASTATQAIKQSNNQTISLDKDQVWQLVKIQGRKVSKNDKTVTLTFNPEAESFRGMTACNFYAGTYTLGEPSPTNGRHSFSIVTFGSGSILCPEADMNAEGRFLSVFEKANYILIDEFTLSFYRDNKEILLFELQ